MLSNKEQLYRMLRGWYVWIIFILFLAISILFAPEFRNLYTWRSIILISVPLLFVTFGQTVIIISGGWDLSVGAVVACATAIASETMYLNPIVGIISVLIFGIAIGAVNGVGVVKARIDSLIMTLGTMFAVSGLALVIRPMPGGQIDTAFSEVIMYTVRGLPLTTLIMFLILSIIGVLLLQRRSFGRGLYAVGGDKEKAKRMGANVERIEFLAYVVSGLTAATGGLILAGEIASGDPLIGLPYLFNSIVAVLFGGALAGVGGFFQVIPAVLMMVSIRSLIRFLEMSSWYDLVVKGALLVAIILVQQRWILRRRVLA